MVFAFGTRLADSARAAANAAAQGSIMINSIKPSRSRVALFGALAGLSVALPASGEDLQRYPAAACQAADNASAGKLTYTAGEVRNLSGNGMATVLCPIESHFYNPWGSETDLTYYDNGSANISCTHYWTNLNGGVYWSWTFFSSGASSSFKKFNVQDPEGLSWFKTWQCTLPASSSISLIGYDYTDAEMYLE